MNTVIKKAIDPNTEKEYEIELPAPEIVRQAILDLDYPTEGIKVKETADKLKEVFKLSNGEKIAKKWDGRRYLDVFRYDIVAPAFKNLLNKGKLKQPGGSRKPYFLADGKTNPSIEEIYQKIRDELVAELLLQIKNNSPAFFEQLVIDLLVAMGYGGSQEDAEAVGRSGDGGIDGVINEDKLGLDVVYVQAKRWNKGSVGEPEIAQFAGALDVRNASKGIFITTSDFTNPARHFSERSPKRIILIDGKLLAQYMIDHSVGVSTVETYEIKRIDSDYFAETK